MAVPLVIVNFLRYSHFIFTKKSYSISKIMLLKGIIIACQEWEAIHRDELH